MRSCVRGLLVAALGVALPGARGAQSADAQWLAEGFSIYGEDNLRWEHWAFFDPTSPGGDPDYDFGANRLRLGVR